VEPSGGAGKHYRHDQDAGSENKYALGLAQTEAADATDEQIADGKIE